MSQNVSNNKDARKLRFSTRTKNQTIKNASPKERVKIAWFKSYDLLAFSDSACRAGSFASTAGYANIGIDVVLCIALGNSSNGAAVSASTARYASVRNYICHKNILLFR